MVEYLKQMADIVTDSTSSEESMQALSAIVTEIKGKEMLIATDQKLSKVLERLIESNGTTLAIVKPIFAQLQGMVLDLVYDQYGSHVFEKVLKSITKVEVDAELGSIVTAFSESICSDIFNLISDPHATFVVRSAALVFGGFPRPDAEKDLIDELKAITQSQELNKFPTAFSSLLMSVLCLDTDALDHLASAPHSSVTLQCLLLLASRINPMQAESLIRKLVSREDGSINAARMGSYLNATVKSKLLEVAVYVLNTNKSNLSKEIFEQFILVVDEEGEDVFDSKFSFGFLQAYVSSLTDPALIELLVTRLLTPEGIRTCVQRGKGSAVALLQRTAETLVRVIEPQRVFVANLLSALKTTKDDVWMTLLSVNASSFDEESTGVEPAIDEAKITPQGCLLMSTMLQLKLTAIQPIVSGSHVLVDYLKSSDFDQSRFINEVGPGRLLQTVISTSCSLPTGIKKKVIRNLILGDSSVDRLTKLVTDRKVGAWLVTAAWDSCAGDIQTKQVLAEALVKINALKELNWKVWRHCGLATFSRRNEEWTQTENKKAKTQNLFKDIIGDDAKPAKKQKQ